MLRISRRQFIGLVAAGVASTIASSSVARALENDSNQLVVFSEEVAATIAGNFARSMKPGLPLKVGTIIPILNTEGVFKGYSVEYLLSGAPSGYAVLEVDYPGLIASFSFSEGSLSQGKRVLDELQRSNDQRSIMDACLIEMDPFCVGYYDEYSGCVISLDSKSQAKSSLVESLRTRANWDEVLISQSEINDGGFTAGSTKYSGELAYITQRMAERGNRRYACGPHALYVIGAALPNDQMNAPIIPDATSNWSCYNKLWDYSDTRKTSESNGVIYGSTASDRLGPAFVRLCAERGTTMRQKYVSDPSFLSIVSHINNAEVAVMAQASRLLKAILGIFLLRMATRTCIGKATIKCSSALPYSMVGIVISSLISTFHPITSRTQLFYTGKSEAPITQRRKENEDGTENRYTRSASDMCGWPVGVMEKLHSRGRLESNARKNEFRLAGRGEP